jgi:phosphoglycerate dehydrogenase-like enzyme
VGELLQAVGVRVQGVGRTAREDDPVFGRIHDMADLNRLSAEQDWVIGVLPSTASTRDVFDAEFFAALSPRARFINIGRGDAVAEDALQQALQSEAIAGAMLDVFKQEPLPEKNPLWDTPNLFVSPHISGDYHSFPRDMVEMFLENLSRYRSGDALANRVDKVQGYAARD